MVLCGGIWRRHLFFVSKYRLTMSLEKSWAQVQHRKGEYRIKPSFLLHFALIQLVIFLTKLHNFNNMQAFSELGRYFDFYA